MIRDGAVSAVIIEADGTEVERANRYVRGSGQDQSATEALSDVTRFPRWMWRNVEFRDFLEALRTENLRRPPARRVSVYGMIDHHLFQLDHVYEPMGLSVWDYAFPAWGAVMVVAGLSLVGRGGEAG